MTDRQTDIDTDIDGWLDKLWLRCMMVSGKRVSDNDKSDIIFQLLQKRNHFTAVVVSDNRIIDLRGRRGEKEGGGGEGGGRGGRRKEGGGGERREGGGRGRGRRGERREEKEEEGEKVRRQSV